MRYANIYTKREYVEDNLEKASWFRTGYLKETDKGAKYIRMFNQPETTFFVFDQGEDEDDEKEILLD